MTDRSTFHYSAKADYDRPGVVAKYEQERFSGLLGGYRHFVERSAVARALRRLPYGVSILDCPCGTGRWWPILSLRASSIVGIDISDEMLAAARDRAPSITCETTVRKGDAETIDMEDASVDFVFSHALTKHLPLPVQYRVLREFSRVARKGVICSFGIFSYLTYAIWRRRRLRESYPLIIEQLQWMANDVGLSILEKHRCTTPIGVEHVVLFAKNSESA